MGARDVRVVASHDKRMSTCHQQPLLVDHVVDLLGGDQVALMQTFQRVRRPVGTMHSEANTPKRTDPKHRAQFESVPGNTWRAACLAQLSVALVHLRLDEFTFCAVHEQLFERPLREAEELTLGCGDDTRDGGGALKQRTLPKIGSRLSAVHCLEADGRGTGVGPEEAGEGHGRREPRGDCAPGGGWAAGRCQRRRRP